MADQEPLPAEKLDHKPAEPGHIIQIVDSDHPWFPCLLIVSEVKAWGVQSCVLAPISNTEPGTVGQCWNRIRWAQFEIVGRANIVP